jgi:hypothetical protein
LEKLECGCTEFTGSHVIEKTFFLKFGEVFKDCFLGSVGGQSGERVDVDSFVFEVGLCCFELVSPVFDIAKQKLALIQL